MIRFTIKILSFIGALCALCAGIYLKNNALYFTSLSLFLAFLGTCVNNKSPTSGTKLHVTQKGGAHSTNTQNISVGSNTGENGK